MGCSLVGLALWAAVALVAATSELESLEEQPAPKWKDMTTRDRTMASLQANDGMNRRTRSFALQQQSDNGVFALNPEDTNSALQQSKRPALDQAAQREAGYLSTDLKVRPEALKVSPQALDRTRRQAVAHAREIEMKSEALREGGRELGESASMSADKMPKTIAALRELASALAELNEVASSDDELGESASIIGTDAEQEKDQKIARAKEKARLQMAELTEKHLVKVSEDKRDMKEAIRKAAQQRSESESRARRLVPDAEELYRSEMRSRKRAAERRYKASQDEAAQRLRNKEAEILKEKQKLSLDAESKKTQVDGDTEKFDMAEKQKYLKQLSEAERTKAKTIAVAKEQATEAKFKIKEHQRSKRTDSKLKSEAESKKFEARKRDLKEKSLQMIENLRQLEGKSIGDAKKRYQVAMESEKATIKRAAETKKKALTVHKEEVEKASAKMKESRGDLGEANKVKRKFNKQEREAKRKISKDLRELKESSSSKISELKGGLQAVKDRERQEEQAIERKGSMSDAEFKKKQLAWMERAKSNAMKNCDDAKKEGILKSKAAHLSISRLSRFLTDQSMHKSNQRDDAKRETKALNEGKEKAAKHLQAVVKKAAIEMSASGKAKSPQVDLVKQAAMGYASKKLPADRAMGNYQKRSKVASKAKELASKRSASWASEKSLTAAAKFKKDADRTCDAQQRWFQKVRHRVKKRMGTSTEKEEKAVAKGEFQEKRWAKRKAKILISKESSMTEASVKAEMKLNSESQQKQTMREKAEKTRLKSAAEHGRKLKESAEETTAKSRLRLEESMSSADAKVLEAGKVKDMAERDKKDEENSARAKEKEEKSSLKAKREAALANLRRQKEKSLKLLKAKRADNGEQLRRVREKRRERQRKAQENEDEQVKEGKKKNTEKARRAHEAARSKLEEIRASLGEAKSEANKRLLQAKLEAAKERMEAKKAMAEALAKGGGKAAIEKARKQSKALLVRSKKRHEKLVADAKKVFEREVQKETKRSLKEVKKANEDLVTKLHKLKKG